MPSSSPIKMPPSSSRFRETTSLSARGTDSSNPLCSSGESGANSTPRLRRPASCEPRAWPFHFWRSLVEKAGYKLSDIPNTWDAFLDFFMPVQDKLRAQGMLFRIGQCKIQIPLSSI